MCMGRTAGMADPQLLRLLTWLSPAFPVGAFAYSHGVERAIHDNTIRDRATLVAWLSDLLTQGSGWNDAVLCAASWRGEDVAELAEAMAGSRERHMETTLQGEAFVQAAEPWTGEGRPAPYPVAVGHAARNQGIALDAVLTAYLHAFSSNIVQAAVRLVPLGQRDGVATLAALEPVILDTAARASQSTLDDLGAATVLSDIAAMRHETQYSRVFRS
ncbi:urease accessory protein UreF [Mesorhizobium sp. RP14(2022)]|uniref:Urease accessory protein UreF n=1 Tax=Mesorhizobium liriopis TaxID=2953882 RepID=A0ABT1C5E4_9HYPH|nr:urease accessory protein UreF [Mesorhizobium liriopis]MCO6049366.1 urease accessory protein UreF [Mesorhizobium liriopis]